MAQTTDSSLATEMAVEEIEAIFGETLHTASMDVGSHQAIYLDLERNIPKGSIKQSARDVGSRQTTDNPGANPDRAEKEIQRSMENQSGTCHKHFLSGNVISAGRITKSSLPADQDVEPVDLHRNSISAKELPLTQTQPLDETKVSISQMLDGFSRLSRNRCIYKVHLNLREENPKAFTPNVISIGPLHRENEELQTMEKHKLHYLQTFLRVTGLCVECCVDLVRTWEDEARSCYAAAIKQGCDEFAKIILLDGCFVVVFILIYFNLLSIRGYHPLNGHTYLTSLVITDMMLLENQLPFFVIKRLYRLVISCPNHFNAESISNWKEFPPTKELVSEFLKRVTNVNIPDRIPRVHHFVDLLRFFYNPTSERQWPESTANACREIFSTPSATHLHAAGVKFERATGSTPIDIEFTDGVLKIHHLLIQEGTEIIFRNLLAFEQLHGPDESITAYLCFLDKLIDTPSDVDLLMKAGVISNIGGSNEDVCKLFNNIWRNANLQSGAQFSCVCKKLNGYYKFPWHKWKATLKREYLSTPWKVMGITVGFSLLILTLIQAVCSVLTAG